MNPEVKTTIISLISVAISLFALYFEEYRILILLIYSITLISYILLSYLNKIEEHEKEINKLKESFKRAEELVDIRADIKSLKRSIK